MLSPFGSLNSSSGAVLPILSPTISCAERELMQMIMFRIRIFNVFIIKLNQKSFQF